MRNVVALVLRLLVDTVLGCLLFGSLCLICNIGFGYVGDFNVWFAFISFGYILSLYCEDIAKFVGIAHRRRTHR